MRGTLGKVPYFYSVEKKTTVEKHLSSKFMFTRLEMFDNLCGKIKGSYTQFCEIALWGNPLSTILFH